MGASSSSTAFPPSAPAALAPAAAPAGPTASYADKFEAKDEARNSRLRRSNSVKNVRPF
jgi:hypothetical protein